MDFWTILLAALMPIARVLLMCSVGAFLAHERIGIITSEGRRTLSQLVLNLFGPALTLDKLTKSLSPTTMLLCWPLPSFVGINIGVGMLVGFSVGRLVAPGPSLGVFMATIALGNYGNLALVLIPALCTDPHSPLSNEPNCQERGIAYIMYGAWLANFFAWTVIYTIMRPPSYADLELSQTSPGEAALPESPLRLPSESNAEVVAVDPRTKVPSFWKQLVQPPVIAIAVAITLAMIPGAKHALFDSGGVLKPLGGCIEIFSNGMIPMIMLILGSGLSRGGQVSSLPPRVIAISIACRLFLTPIICLSLLVGAEALHLLAPGDMVLRMVLVIQQCGPAAVILGTIANLHKHEVGTVSLTLFWQYLLAGPVLCLYMMVFFWLYGNEMQPVDSVLNATAS